MRSIDIEDASSDDLLPDLNDSRHIVSRYLVIPVFMLLGGVALWFGLSTDDPSPREAEHTTQSLTADIGYRTPSSTTTEAPDVDDDQSDDTADTENGPTTDVGLPDLGDLAVDTSEIDREIDRLMKELESANAASAEAQRSYEAASADLWSTAIDTGAPPDPVHYEDPYDTGASGHDDATARRVLLDNCINRINDQLAFAERRADSEFLRLRGEAAAGSSVGHEYDIRMLWDELEMVRRESERQIAECQLMYG